MEWEDVDDKWTAPIKAAHPSRSDSHDAYGIAMQMVGHRHSKGELLALVNWLVFRLHDCAIDRDSPDTCGVCGLHFADCEKERVQYDDAPGTPTFPACAGGRARVELLPQK